MSLARGMMTSALCLAAIGAIAAPAFAASTLQANFYQVANGSDADFGAGAGTPQIALGSTLGPDGLPVATGGVSDIASNGELTWWSPALNSNVVYTGTATVSLPYASNMYAPNSTGVSDARFFETAVLSGVFTLTADRSLSFALGADDDAYLYVDGALFGQQAGLHGVSYATFTTPTLGAGDHTLQIFYADRARTGAYLSLTPTAGSADVTISAPTTSAVPEPASWAMMVGGFGMMGGMIRRRRPVVSFA